MQIAQLMIPELHREGEMTRGLLAKIPDEKLEWSPGHGLHTIGWNASHLAEILGWVPGIIAANDWDIAPPDGEPYSMKTCSSVADLLSQFDSNLSSAGNALKSVSDAAMDEPWSLKMGDQILFTMPRGDCLRKWVFSHTSHHRGILSAYMRISDVEVPSIFEG